MTTFCGSAGVRFFRRIYVSTLQAKIQHNIGELNDVIRRYRGFSKLSDSDILTKQGGKLGRALHYQLLNVRPAKGAVRAQVLARLKAGQRVKVRDEVVETVKRRWEDKFKAAQARFEDRFWGDSDPQHNWKWKLRQKMVQLEIARREQGRGVLGFSAHYPIVLGNSHKVRSKFGPLLSQAGVRLNEKGGGEAMFHWPGETGPSQKVAESFDRPVPGKALLAAIQETKADILKYVLPREQRLAEMGVSMMVEGGKA